MKIQRRDFIKHSALGLGGLWVAPGLGAKQAEATGHFNPFTRVALGRTGLKVSRLCMGTGSHGSRRESNQTRLGQGEYERLLREAHERGVGMFDLADLYGSHAGFANAMHGVPRDKYCLVTKIWWRPGSSLPEPDRPDADVVVERFLGELKTDHIDLLLLHCVKDADWPQRLRRQMDILSRLKAQGKIRALGVSCHTLAALQSAACEPWVESVHARINPYGMSMDGAPEQVVPVLRKIHAAGKGVVGMKIIGEGRLRNDPLRRAESIRFALNLGCVDVLNVGFEKTAELEDFIAQVRRTQIVKW